MRNSSKRTLKGGFHWRRALVIVLYDLFVVFIVTADDGVLLLVLLHFFLAHVSGW